MCRLDQRALIMNSIGMKSFLVATVPRRLLLMKPNNIALAYHDGNAVDNACPRLYAAGN